MSKIIFFARDPGGANSLATIIHESKKFCQCEVYAKDFAKTSFERSKVEYQVAENADDILLSRESSRILFTGTSYGGYVEHDLWSVASENNVKSIAYLDHWMGYDRFYNPSIEDYVFPDQLIVIDKHACEAFKEKFPGCKSKLHSLGSTFLEGILKNQIDKSSVLQLRNSFISAGEQKLYVYAAEKIKGLAVEEKYTFNEFDQFLKLYDELKILKANGVVWFIPHPKHTEEDIKEGLQSLKFNDTDHLVVKVAANIDKDKLIQVADYVFGVNTMVLVEAMLLEKQVCSIQIGCKEKSDFALLHKNYIYEADTLEKLGGFLSGKSKTNIYDKSYIENSLSRILCLIKREFLNE